MSSIRKKRELQQQEKEFKYARWFWRPADTDSWQATKVLVTVLASFLLGVFGYVACSAVFSNLFASIIGV